MAWTLIGGTLSASLTTSQYQFLDLVQFASSPVFSDTGCTVLRSHIALTPTSGPALGDTFICAAGVVRNGDIGTNVTGGIQPDLPNYPWAYQNQWAMNGNLNGFGGNRIEIDIKSKRHIRSDNEAFALGIKSGFAAAVQFRVWARTLIALP